MRRISIQRSWLFQNKSRLGGMVAMAGIFAFVGVRLLAGSNAEPLTPATTSLSLAPANVSVKQGDIINVAVNMTVGAGDSAGDVKATVAYPAAQLELQSVQQACPLPGFTSGGSENPKAGEVVVTCKSESGVVATQTVATMVFRAVTDTGDAPITVEGDTSTVVSHRSNKQRILQRTGGAEVALQSRKNRPPVKRPPQNISGRPVCTVRLAGHARCHAFHGTEADGSEQASDHAASSGYGPQEYHMGYQMPCTPGGPIAAVCATPSTYGPTTVAIVDAGAYTGGPTQLESDLQTFNQKYGIPPCTIASGCLSVLNQRGATSPMPKDAGWTDEINMDVIAVHEMCQTCKIVLILSDSTSSSSMDAAHAYAATLKPVAISDSWSGSGGSAISTYTHPGIAQLIADGDDGVLANEENNPVDFATVVAVSGSQLQVNSDGTWAGETLWSGSGGGCSPTEPPGSWQSAQPNWASVGCGSKRAYGDIVAAGGPQSAMAQYFNGSWSTGYGTSLSAPLLAGMYAVANPNGIPNTVTVPQAIYSKFNSTNSHDITTGTDCTAQTKTHCTAGAGYDVPSGMGAPYGVAALALGSGGTTPPPTTPPPTTPPPTTPPPTTPPPTTPPPGSGKKGDINNDGRVNISDLSVLLSNWGKATTTCDLNGSGKVDLSDLSILLSSWTG